MITETVPNEIYDIIKLNETQFWKDVLETYLFRLMLNPTVCLVGKKALQFCFFVLPLERVESTSGNSVHL